MNRRSVLTVGGTVLVAGAGATFAGLRQMGSMGTYAAAVAATRTVLTERPEMRALVRYATLAPNSHNTQAWRFQVGPRGIVVTPDFQRRTPVVDPDDHHLFASMGSAAENLALACRASGHPGDLRFDSGAVTFDFGDGPPGEAEMFEAITRRQSTRGDYDGRPVSPAELTILTAAASVPGVDLVLITDPRQVDRVRDLVVAGNSAQMADAAFMRELKAWLRFSPRQAIETGDGLFSAASGSPVLPSWLGPSMVDWFFRAGSENDKYARQLRSSAGVAIFVARHAGPEHWVLAGRASQRFALKATALGLKCAFINQPVEVATLRPELAVLAGMPGRRPDLVMRFGYGPTMPFSARRPVEHVMSRPDE